MGTGVKSMAINKEVKEAGSSIVGDGKSKLVNEDIGTKKEYKKPDPSGIKAKLTPLQFEVTQEGGTEEPFNNKYWLDKRDGIYVDIVTVSPFSARSTNLILGQAGRVSQSLSNRERCRAGETHLRWDGGTEQTCRLAPRACLSRRAGADRTQVLHQFRLFEIHLQTRPCEGGLRGVLGTVSKEMITASGLQAGEVRWQVTAIETAFLEQRMATSP